MTLNHLVLVEVYTDCIQTPNRSSCSRCPSLRTHEHDGRGPTCSQHTKAATTVVLPAKKQKTPYHVILQLHIFDFLHPYAQAPARTSQSSSVVSITSTLPQYKEGRDGTWRGQTSYSRQNHHMFIVHVNQDTKRTGERRNQPTSRSCTLSVPLTERQSIKHPPKCRLRSQQRRENCSKNYTKRVTTAVRRSRTPPRATSSANSKISRHPKAPRLLLPVHQAVATKGPNVHQPYHTQRLVQPLRDWGN